jgi:large subunit ribosomal protein L3
MIDGLIGRKIGMTQIFEDNGVVIPVTVIQAGPCVVVQRKTEERDGYRAVQLGLVDAKSARKANKPMRGHHALAGVPPTRMRREFAIDAEDALKPGDAVSVDIFEGVSSVDVIGTSKGKGYQGVMRRHKFRGGAGSHGSMFHRAPGSIGSSAFPSRVFPGMRAAGHMGDVRVTAKNLVVVRLDKERNLLLVRGSIPGARSGLLLIRRSPHAAVAGGA